MKINYLFPNKFKNIGWLIFIPSAIIGLITLILESKSMDTEEEKQSRFNLMPMMSKQQISKLNDILTREKQKLAEIETKYEQKKDDIKEKYIQRRQSM
jgi:hypothetical protein